MLVMLQVKTFTFFVLGRSVAGVLPLAQSCLDIRANSGVSEAFWAVTSGGVCFAGVSPGAPVHFDFETVREVAEALRALSCGQQVVALSGSQRPHVSENFRVGQWGITAFLRYPQEVTDCLEGRFDLSAEVRFCHD